MSRWARFFSRRKRMMEDLDQDIRDFIERETQDNIERGMSSEEARYAALRKFGNVTRVKEETWEVWSFVWLEQLWQDVRFGLRMLAKSPGFTTVAVLTLALGVGANTAIFSLINTLILRALPVRNPEQLVAIATVSPDAANGEDRLSLAMFEEIVKHQQVFSNLFAWNGHGLIDYEANGVKYAAGLDTVSGDYFSTLGIQPLLGRLIGPSDVGFESGSSAPVAVISYACWQRRYGSDPSIIGKVIRVNDQPLTIIGIAPKGFTGVFVEAGPDAFLPIGFSGGTGFRKPESLALDVVGRLKPGASLPQARADLASLWPGIRAATAPPDYKGERRAQFLARRINVESITTGNSLLRRRFRYDLELLMGAVGLVLLISCLNLASLTLARAAAREHEIGIRAALGASGWRVVRQFVTESVMLSGAGALLGLAFAFWASRALVNAIWTAYVPPDLDLTPDLRVLVFTTGVAGLATLLFGLVPAWLVTRTNPAVALQSSTRLVRGPVRRFNRGLVVAQVSLSLIVVVGATLLVRSLAKLRSTDPGYRREGALVIQLFPQAGHEKIPDRVAYYRELADKLLQLPGVESVSYSHMGPVFPYEYKVPVSVASSSLAPVDAVEDWVGPGFFRLIGMHVLEGREFDWRDDQRAPRVAVVSQSLARRLAPGTSPIGRKIRISSEPDHKDIEVVGIVNSASLWKIQSHEPMAFYTPLMQEPRMNQELVDLRIAGKPQALSLGVRGTIESLGHHFPLRTQTLEERAEMDLNMDQMVASLSALFAGLALVLASIGLYGLITYAVSRRTAEIGVRRALGAQQGDVLWMVIREAVSLVGIGVTVGIAGALLATRLISSMLFGLKPTDPLSFGLATSLLIGVGLLAGYIPARRAAKVDPMVALRHE
jgi:predicted permease